MTEKQRNLIVASLKYTTSTIEDIARDHHLPTLTIRHIADANGISLAHRRPDMKNNY